jgi:hypothetical protein
VYKGGAAVPTGVHQIIMRNGGRKSKQINMTLEQQIQYETQGFLHIPAALDAAMLGRLKSAFDAAVQKYPIHLKNASAGFFDIPHILDVDDVFVDLVDAPTIFLILLQLLGETFNCYRRKHGSFLQERLLQLRGIHTSFS